MVHVVKADLTRHIPLLTQELSGEVQRSIHEALGSNAQYTEVNVFPKLLRVVAIVSGLAFVGSDMYRQEEYITNSITFTVDLFGAIAKLKAWPNWGPVRAIAARFIAPVKRLHIHRQKAYDYFIPRIQERRKATAGQEAGEKPKDMLQWMINKADKFGIKNDEEIAMILILLGVAAIHTTTLTVVHILYDLIGHCPEVITELRKEIQTAMDGQGGKITTEALYQMKLLDSVMRESARLNPTNVMRMQRSVLQSFQLSDGTLIPAGVDIAVPALPVNLDEFKYPDALRFDPYRFVHLRSGEKTDPIGYASRELYQFISVTKENMAFGFGKPACPGRFFAAAEIKLILIFILIDYEIKMPDGFEGRYANNVRGTSITPDFSKSIMIRSRA
ncbi:ent-kaurene oxidase [Colletotrichum orchidophilum]|uniref:Ent-kaurene oxidase n=1 Tax=Colletotrichum orchidophilum TaxID=1209926 RepID=A0A1G4BT45_9PEZI|nr:ent-kaurene oxidase [Colletotrichum orchidophilum]OHF04561.1 ent-kaurene oxidase [Colletotrichum orchidophilum]